MCKGEPDYWTYITNGQYRAFSPIKPPDNAYTEGTLEPLYAAPVTARNFVATFRCESNDIVGSTNAPIHSVNMHDDGVVEVVIDHWPEQDAEIEALRAEVDALRGALGRILENEASDWKAAEEFGGYVLDDELREEARAALLKENIND